MVLEGFWKSMIFGDARHFYRRDPKDPQLWIDIKVIQKPICHLIYNFILKYFKNHISLF